MIYLITALAIAILVCGYYYFQSVNLSRQLYLHKKELAALKRNYAGLFTNSEQMTSAQERIYQHKMRLLKQHGYENDYELKALEPLINHFSFIAKEYLKEKGDLNEIVKSFYEQNEQGSFRKLANVISEQNADVRNAWQQNNLMGLIYLIDMLAMQKQFKAEEEKQVAAGQ